MAEILEALFTSDIKKLNIIFENIDVNCTIPGTDGCTPLHIIAGMEKTINKECVICFLLEKGADPNARSCENLTPVHIASMWGNCFELEKLLQNGGDPWLIDNENKNAFDMAADNYAYEAFQLLNIYLAEDKLNYKRSNIKVDTSKKYEAYNIDYDDFKNTNESNYHVNTMFATANENFPLILSSINEDHDDLALNMSNYIKKKSFKSKLNKQDEKKGDYNSSDSSVFKSNQVILDNVSLINVNDGNVNSVKNAKTILNHAYIFSSTEGETTDTTSALDFYLNLGNNCKNETVVDSEDGIILVETECNTTNCNSFLTSISTGNSWKSFQNMNMNSSSLSYCSTHSKTCVAIPDELKAFSNSRIYQELLSLGDNPGPVLDHTREVYLLRLARLKSGCQMLSNLVKPKYSPEVYMFLNDKLDMARAKSLEKIMEAEFDADFDNKWREGNQRCCFNYFLLDPRITQNFPSTVSDLNSKSVFLTFLDSLFYIGKGTKGRPYSHLLEAAKSSKVDLEKSDKINHILDIWNAGLGVISLHCFKDSKPVEAYTREACIIDAIGLENLTNIKKGDYYGSCSQLTPSRKRMIGVSLLNRALLIFLLEGERQIKLKDIQKK